jgi:vancomycin resistance protein YoaR
MNHPHNHKADLLTEITKGGFCKAAKLPMIVVIALLFFFISGAYVWAQSYEGRITPNVFVGNIEVGGLTPEEAREVLQSRADQIITSGIPIIFQGEQKTLPFATLVGTDLIEVLSFNIDGAVADMMAMHGNNPLTDTLIQLQSLAGPTRADIDLELTHETLKVLVRNAFPETETLSTNASFDLVYGANGWSAEVVEGTVGYEFQFEPFFEKLYSQLGTLNRSKIEIGISTVEPMVNKTDSVEQLNQAIMILNNAPYQLAYESFTQELTAPQLAILLTPGDEGQVSFLEDEYLSWLFPIQAALNIESRDARLEIEDGRVVDFVHSRAGLQVEAELLKEALLETVRSQNDEVIEIAVAIDEPSVLTGDVNDLGITEILGTGTSSYRGSPWNRRQNIQNGVDLLNGRLIAPGETFSLIEALSPFTYENGYLPELVIKGDKIEPELGGGLCQIGTTTFRATMHAGLAVSERRNHSLVVFYYNDPSNGNPGTDATIYEPAPDYKFTNNTDSHVLFQAENLTDTSDLRFTFWGTSDGRKGSYSPPIVHRWIPVDETTYIETEDLEPGEETCQEAHIGADASFTYTVLSATGETEETLFESHYRPLPKICLVGVEEESEDEETKNSDDESEVDEEDELDTE